MADDMKIQGGWFDFKIKEGTKTVNLNDELKEIFLDMIREHNEKNVSTRQPDPRAIVKAEEI